MRDPHVQNLQPAKSAVGSKSSQRSGAYIFRPADDPEHAGAKRIHLGDEPVLLSTLQGTDVSEVRQVFSDWASQVVRVFRGSEVVEVEWTVGPIPIDDLLGREVISRFESNLNTQNLVYTDANGRCLVVPRTLART